MREHLHVLFVALIVCPLMVGCGGGSKKSDVGGDAKDIGPAVALTAIDLSDAVNPVPQSGGIVLASAKNETTSFVVQIGPRLSGATYTLRVNAPAALPAAGIEVCQVLTMPVDVNRAGYVRHTGQDTGRNELPRALLPMRPAADGSVDLASLRNPARAIDPTATLPPTEAALLWIDLHTPIDAPAGDLSFTVDVLSGGTVVTSLPLKLKIHDFALPTERHLQLVGRLNWEDLERLYADRFEAIRPKLVNRREERYRGAVRVIDSLIQMAHQHRTSVIVPRLQPTVKWPPGAPPDIDWTDFDSLAGPWLTGEAFKDKVPAGFWPLPSPDLLERYVRSSQLDYWSLAATHFDQNDWLSRSPIWIEKFTPGRATEAEAAELSQVAAETVAVHQRLRAAVPLETDQLIVAPAGENVGQKIDPSSTPRLLSAAPGLVFAPPMRLWPEAVERPQHYLRTDMPALVPYIGAGGDERDVRLWAWLAFLRQASLINFSDALPSLSNPTEPANPNELIWFYPGEWFGQDEPVPTIQLKWLRRAQQDFEYLWLARERGDRDTRITALLMARLITKPVEIHPGQNPDPAYAMMSGTTDQKVWTEAQRLLSEMILLHPTGGNVDAAKEHSVHIETLRWAQPQERPLLMGRTTEWMAESSPPNTWLHLRLGVDIYNASDVTPGENLLAWSSVARDSAWEIATQPTPVPVLATYNVRRTLIDAKFDLEKITPAARKPMELTFTNGFTNRTASLKLLLPIASSDRREGPLNIDGRTDDWNEADLVQNGPLVKMLSRPSLQRQELESASTDSKVYTSWAAGHFYVAFDLNGISSAPSARAQNFVDYQFRRAWSEDLCEILIQPMTADGIPGPVLHVVCKPNGSNWVERKNNITAATPKPWQEVEAGIQYASRPEGDKWSGEVKIPWKAILDAVADAQGKQADAEPPALLRFNFVQHRTATGESASWSGPVDFGRDDSFMGVLYLRDPEEPGPRNIAGGSSGFQNLPAEQ